MGFGWLAVRGRRRVPSPPAMITAFTGGLRATFSNPDARPVLQARGTGTAGRL
jgi:hypothetical protein